MRALPSLLHVLVTFAALTSTCGAGAEEDTNSVGTVNKVENEAQVISASGRHHRHGGTPVHMKNELRSPTRGFRLPSATTPSSPLGSMRAS